MYLCLGATAQGQVVSFSSSCRALCNMWQLQPQPQPQQRMRFLRGRARPRFGGIARALGQMRAGVGPCDALGCDDT